MFDNDEYNMQPLDRVIFCEQQIVWWISNHPSLLKTQEYINFWESMQEFVKARMLGKVHYDMISDVCLSAVALLDYAYKHKLSPHRIPIPPDESSESEQIRTSD